MHNLERRRTEGVQKHQSLCEGSVPVVGLAVVLFYFQGHGEGVEVTVGQTGQRRVPDVRRPGGTSKRCGETVQDTTHLEGERQDNRKHYR